MVGVLYFTMLFGMLVYKISTSREERYLLYLSTVLLVLYCFITHKSKVEDPLTDYFYHNDQIVFYKDGLRLSKMTLSEVFSEPFKSLLYIRYQLYALLLGLVFKIGQFIQVQDLLLFAKLHTVLGSLCLLIVTSRWLNRKGSYFTLNGILAFLIGTHFFLQAVILTRDMIIAASFTAMLYYLFIDRKILSLLLVVILVFLRLEHGVIATITWAVFFFKSRMSNFVVLAVITITLLSIIDFQVVLDEFFKNSAALQSHTESISNSGSVVLRARSLPIPINMIVLTIYSVVQPFPVSLYLSESMWSFPSIISGYLLSVVMVLFFSLYRFLSNEEKRVGFVLITAIVLSSFIEPNVRRNMPFYPFLFIMVMSNMNLLKKRYKLLVYTNVFLFIVVINLAAFAYIN